MDNEGLVVKNNVLNNIALISIKTDTFDIIARDSKGKGLKIYFDSKPFLGCEELGALMLNYAEKSICFELFEKDLHIDKTIKHTEPNPAIIVELPIGKELKISIETRKSDIYLSEEILECLNKKIFCSSEEGNVLRKCFMYFEKVV